MTNSLVGQHLANYRVEYLLGRGGMAEVYYAHDVKLQRPVAIKLIDARFRDNPDYARRFLQEARTIATWRHENIVQVYYADEQDGIYFFAMEYIDGLDLAEILRKYGDDGELMPHEDVLNIGWVVASALDYAHQKGVIHRDIKPSNIMIARDNRVVLMDFGLALDVQEGTLGETFGTAHYIAPEQAMKSSNAVPASDLYALGVILYEMLTGVVPFDDESYTSVVMQHLTEPPPSPLQYNAELNAEVEPVLMKALAKEPQQRYATGLELMDALAKALTTRPNLGDTAKYKLPPIPSSVSSQPSLSKVSVADRIAFEQSMRDTATPFPSVYPEETAQPTSAHQPSGVSRKFPLIPVIGGLVLLVVLIGAFFVFGSRGDAKNNEDKPTENVVAQNPTMEVRMPTATIEEPSVEPTQSEMNTPVPPPTEANVVPSVTPITQAPEVAAPSATPNIPVFTKEPTTPTDTVEPPSPTVVNTDVPTPTPLPPVETEIPTVAYPAGYTFTFYYDGVSFYASNTGGRSFNITDLSFEALDANNSPTGKIFPSNRWITIGGYAFIDNNRCNAIEIGGETLTVPAQCRGFNARINPFERERFWLNIDNATEFRILWSGEEVGRCPLFVDSTQECSVNLPQ